MIPVCLLMLAEVAAADPGMEGRACYYAPGVMERVAANRGMSLAGYLDGVALMECGRLGRTVWLETLAGKVDGPYLVVDCAAPQHYAARVAAGDVVEVGWRTAQRWGMRGPVAGVRVWLAGQTRAGR